MEEGDVLRARFDNGTTDYGGTWGKWFNQTAPLTRGRWHHIALSYDAAKNEAALWVDYTERARETLTVNKQNNTEFVFPGLHYAAHANGDYKIGVYYNVGEEQWQNPLNGWIDEVRLFNRAVGPESFLRSEASVRAPADTLAWYRMTPPAVGAALSAQKCVPNEILANSIGASASDGACPVNSLTDSTTGTALYPNSVFVWTQDLPPYLGRGDEVVNLQPNSGGIFFPDALYGNGEQNTTLRFTIADIPTFPGPQGWISCFYNTNMTYEVAFKASGEVDRSRYIFCRAGAADLLDYDFRICISPSSLGSKLRVSVAYNLYWENGIAKPDRVELHSPKAVNDNRWHTCALVYDHAQLEARVYLDRVLIVTMTLPNSMLCRHPARAFFVGGTPYDYTQTDGYNFNFDGLIDEVRVTASVLTPDQMLRLRNSLGTVVTVR